MDHLTATEFYKQFRSIAFQNHRQVIAFLDQYQQPEQLTQIPAIVQDYYQTHCDQIMKCNQFYQGKQLVNMVNDAIHTVFNPHQQDQTLHFFPIELSDGAGSFECFSDIQTCLQEFIAGSQETMKSFFIGSLGLISNYI